MFGIPVCWIFLKILRDEVWDDRYIDIFCCWMAGAGFFGNFFSERTPIRPTCIPCYMKSDINIGYVEPGAVHEL